MVADAHTHIMQAGTLPRGVGPRLSPPPLCRLCSRRPRCPCVARGECMPSFGAWARAKGAHRAGRACSVSVGGPLLSYLLGEPEMDGFLFFLPPVYEVCRGVYRHSIDMGRTWGSLWV